MSPTAQAADLAATVERLEREVTRLERENRSLESDLEEAEGRANAAENELADHNERWDPRRDQLAALAHARNVLENLPDVTHVDAFTQIMNERAVDAITELLGDR